MIELADPGKLFAAAAPPAARPAAYPAFDPRTLPIYDLYRRLRHLVLSPERLDGPEALSTRLLGALVETAQATEGGAALPLIAGGRAYRRLGAEFELVAKAGAAGPVALGYRVPVGYEAIAEVLAKGWVLMRGSDPRFDPAIEAPIGAQAFAAIALGPAREILLSFTLREPFADEELVYALATLRSIADMMLRQRELASFIDGAKEIQTSLLPTAAPRVAGYDIAFRSRPAEIVGGDAYDFLPSPGRAVGLAIADATGHGLPAALQARDAVIGLRMGVEERLARRDERREDGAGELVRTVAKLGRVVDASGTSGRFISLVYAELGHDGELAYVNAGHVLPLLVRASGEAVLLETSGPVMGLGIPASYEGFVERLAPGDLLLAYTDGLTEARNPAGDELGIERLIQVARQMPGAAAATIVEGIWKTVDRFCRGNLQEDDQTLLAIRRTA